MKRIGLSAALLGAVMATIPAHGSAHHRCSSVVLRSPDGTVFTGAYDLRARGVSCIQARRVARAFLRGSEGAGAVHPFEFRCAPSAPSYLAVVCIRRHSSVIWHYGA